MDINLLDILRYATSTPIILVAGRHMITHEFLWQDFHHFRIIFPREAGIIAHTDGNNSIVYHSDCLLQVWFMAYLFSWHKLSNQFILYGCSTAFFLRHCTRAKNIGIYTEVILNKMGIPLQEYHVSRNQMASSIFFIWTWQTITQFVVPKDSIIALHLNGR